MSENGYEIYVNKACGDFTRDWKRSAENWLKYRNRTQPQGFNINLDVF